MKSLLSLFIVISLFNISFSQCPSGPISLSSDADIASFAMQYPNCEDFPDNIGISSPFVSSLSGLSNLKSVGGNLSIANTNLTSLSGLNGITSVGGALSIFDNPGLQGISALNNLVSIGSLSYGKNNIANLTNVFPNLETVNTSISIDENLGLMTFSGFSQLLTIGVGVEFFDNDNLTSINGFENLTTIGSFLSINNNNNLNSISGFQDLASLGLLRLRGNPISNISAFDHSISMNSLEIQGTNLSVCNVQSVCDFLATSPSMLSVVILNNNAGCNSRTEVEVACGTLPIELVSFTAKVIGNNSVVLEWKTESEFNNDFISCQHSKNGFNFSDLSFFYGEGNTYGSKSYSFVHRSPQPGSNYYRLKQVDYDGTETVSNVLNIQIVSDIPVLYPNPTTRTLTIQTPKELIGSSAKLIDIDGKPVKNFLINSDNHIVDLSELSNGIYMLIMSGLNKSYKSRIVKF